MWKKQSNGIRGTSGRWKPSPAGLREAWSGPGATPWQVRTTPAAPPEGLPLALMQVPNHLVGLPDEVTHDLGGGLNVVDQTTGLPSIEDRVVDIACKAGGGIGTRRVAHELHPGAAAFCCPCEGPFPWAVARRWAPCRFPLRDRFVPQDPVGRVPPHIEERRIDRVHRRALHHTRLVGWCHERLVAAEKSRPHRDRLRAEAERRHQTPAIADPTCRN